MLRASEESSAPEFAYADVTGHDVHERHLGTGELRELHTSPESAAEMLDGSLALQPGDHQPASHDQQEVVTGFAAPEPARQRFAEWSLRYVLVLAGVDALIGGVSAAVPASLSPTLYAYQAVPLLCLIGLLLWPTAIGVSRGYLRARIGVGSDEFRAVLVAGAVMVVACALPAGFLVVQSEALSPSLAIASPFFALLKRACGRCADCGHFQLDQSCLCPQSPASAAAAWPGHPACCRDWKFCGSSAARCADPARAARGMKVIGVCLPSEELPRPVVDGIPVLGNLDQVAEVVRTLGCDAVAVTSDDATRHSYLRKLAWSLEGAGVELLVDPGLEEVAGPRLHIRPHHGIPAGSRGRAPLHRLASARQARQ